MQRITIQISHSMGIGWYWFGKLGVGPYRELSKSKFDCIFGIRHIYIYTNILWGFSLLNDCTIVIPSKWFFSLFVFFFYPITLIFFQLYPSSAVGNWNLVCNLDWKIFLHSHDYLQIKAKNTELNGSLWCCTCVLPKRAAASRQLLTLAGQWATRRAAFLSSDW